MGDDEARPSVFRRWSQIEGMFVGAGETCDEITPGIYDIVVVNNQVHFVPVKARTDELLKFPSSSSAKVVDEIERFWTREEVFRSRGLPYKRGILLYGPPGAGKSCTIQLIERNLVDRGGVCLIFQHPQVFLAGYRVFRMIQPETPLVVVMEDLDAILERSNESLVLNLLDGAESVDKVVFLATTNYPQKLGPRIVNRPSRFDRRYKVAHPGDDSREIYLSHLADGYDLDVSKWVRDTKGMSLAHLKELFVGVVVLGSPYDEVLACLREMKERIGDWDDDSEFLPVQSSAHL